MSSGTHVNRPQADTITGAFYGDIVYQEFPDDLYTAIRKRARENGSSIRAEVIKVLEQNVVTLKELRRRRRFFNKLAQLRASEPPSKGPFPASEEMVREDRER